MKCCDFTKSWILKVIIQIIWSFGKVLYHDFGDEMHTIYHRMELMLLMYTFSLAGFVEFSDDI